MSSLETGFARPDYAAHGLAQVAPTIESLFGLRPPTALRALLPPDPPPVVALVLLDGFGWNHWLEHGLKHEFFRRVHERGIARPISSVFPSSTLPALTTLHTGLAPAAHGLAEWFLHLPELGGVCELLPFRRRFRRAGDLERLGHGPGVIYRGETLYQRLAAGGVPSRILSAYAESPFSRATGKGAILATTPDFGERFRQLRAAAAEGRREYLWIYHEAIDSVAHADGPGSPAHLAAIESTAQRLQQELVEKGGAGDALVIFTADHGHVAHDVAGMIRLNDRPPLAALATAAPWGGPRDVLLPVKEGREVEARDEIAASLGDAARVLTVDEAIAEGLFGGTPSAEHRPRFGSVLILPRAGRSAWWRHEQAREWEMPGIHGGLSPEEMTVPFAAVRLSQLR